MSLKLKVTSKNYEAYLKDLPHLLLEQHKSDITGGLYYKVLNGRTGKEYKLRKFYHGDFQQDQEVDCSCEHFQHRAKEKGEACKHLIYLHEKMGRRKKEIINYEGGMIA